MRSASRSIIPSGTRPGSPPRCATAPKRYRRSRPSPRSTISPRSRPACWSMSLSLRDVKAHAAMIALYERMPAPMQRAKMMREQLGFALNRVGRFEEAEEDAQGGDRGVRSPRARPMGCSAAATRTAGRSPARAALQKRAASCGAPSTPIWKASRPTGVTPIRASTRSP